MLHFITDYRTTGLPGLAGRNGTDGKKSNFLLFTSILLRLQLVEWHYSIKGVLCKNVFIFLLGSDDFVHSFWHLILRSQQNPFNLLKALHCLKYSGCNSLHLFGDSVSVQSKFVKAIFLPLQKCISMNAKMLAGAEVVTHYLQLHCKCRCTKGHKYKVLGLIFRDSRQKENLCPCPFSLSLRPHAS